MWEFVEEGSCVECWLKKLHKLDAKIELVGKDDWYRIWCPARTDFYHFSVSDEIAARCAPLEERLRTMDSLKGLI